MMHVEEEYRLSIGHSGKLYGGSCLWGGSAMMPLDGWS